MNRRSFLGLVTAGSLCTGPAMAEPSSAARAVSKNERPERLLKRLDGIDDLIIHYEDGLVASVHLQAHDVDGAWDSHEATIDLPAGLPSSRLHLCNVPPCRVLADHCPPTGPGALWLTFSSRVSVRVYLKPNSVQEIFVLVRPANV